MQPLVDLMYEIDFIAEDIAFMAIEEDIIREVKSAFSSVIADLPPNALLIL